MLNNLGSTIKHLREKSGLSRAQFERKFGVSQRSLKAYENGENPISRTKTTLFRNIFKSLGYDLDTISHDPSNTEQFFQSITFDTEDIKIKKEVDFFKKNNPEFILYTVSNEFMAPIFNTGDIIAGIKNSNRHSFEQLQGTMCIIMDQDHEKFLGHFVKLDRNVALVTYHNFLEAHNQPILHIKNVVAIAQVTRHWRLHKRIRVAPEPTLIP